MTNMVYNYNFYFLEGSVIPWNDFFQIILYICLAPNVAVFYGIFLISMKIALLNIQADFQGMADFESIKKLAELFDTQALTEGIVEESFKHLDINEDGFLSLHQLFNFVSRTAILWKPLYFARIHLLDVFFPKNGYSTILFRKLNLRETIQYMMLHNGNLPPINCIDNIFRIIQGKPHPLEGDYLEDLCRNSNNKPYIAFAELTGIFVKIYNPSYIVIHESFSSKHLKAFTTTEALSNIDNFYLLFRKKYRYKESMSSRNFSSIMLELSAGKNKSILKQSSGRFSTRNAITPINDENQTFKF